jgi:hypothetical protein
VTTTPDPAPDTDAAILAGLDRALAAGTMTLFTPAPCTPDAPHDADGWSTPYDAQGHPRPYACEACGRVATPAEADAEDERRYDASLPDMTGYAEA